MELKEAKHILESLGYNIKNPFMNEEKQYLTELMARFNGNYTGRFKGLQDAGDVTIQLAKGNKTEEVAKALSDVDNNFQSAMTTGIKTTQTEKLANLINNYTAIYNVIKDIPDANPETVQDLEKKIGWLEQKQNDGEEIVAGEWKAAGLATTTHSTDDNALDFNTLVKNISAQISSLKSKGGNNTEQIVARIDDLANREGLTQAQLDKVEELRAKLDVATAAGARAAAARGRALTFKSDRPLKVTRAIRRLTALAINFTQNEDGSVTVNDTPRKVEKAREELTAIGVEFVEAQAPAEEQPMTVKLTFGDEDSLAIALEEAQNAGVTAEQAEDGNLTAAFTGTQAALASFEEAISQIEGVEFRKAGNEEPDLNNEEDDGAQIEDSTKVETPKEPEMNESTEKSEDTQETETETLDESVDPVLEKAAGLLLW